jgi:hypothetical protein
MKLVKRLLIFIAILLVLFLAGASVFVKFYGKGLIEETLKSALSREVSIEAMSYRFPLVLQARNIHIAHLIKGGARNYCPVVIGRGLPVAIDL